MSESLRLDGVTMAPVATADVGEISGETLMTFEQPGLLVTGRYRGGAIIEEMGDGRMRMIGHFQWATRPTGGANIFEQLS